LLRKKDFDLEEDGSHASGAIVMRLLPGLCQARPSGD